MSDRVHPLTLDRAALVIDATGVDAAPGVVLRRGDAIIAAGHPEAVGVPAEAIIREWPDSAILPALANAHAHLDLSGLEPEPFDGDFGRWLGRVRDFRRSLDVESARTSMARGVGLSLAGGVAVIGDIVGAPLAKHIGRAMETLQQGGLRGVSFVEVFGVGATRNAALEAIASVPARGKSPDVQGGDGTRLRLGIQPHAPYSTCDEVIAAALQADAPLSIHLAETPEEVEFLRDGRGPLRSMLEGFGIAVEGGLGAPPSGVRPVEWFCRQVSAARAGSSRDADAPPVMAVHLNSIEADDPARLAAAQIGAIYCPRAAAYFGRGGMPWRALREAGARVALGTDGWLCVDTPDRLSTLDEMRLLARRDHASLAELLPMATTAAAEVLGIDPSLLSLRPGVKPGLIRVNAGVDPRRTLLLGDSAPEWLHTPEAA
ncbi:MAG: amidohydrolase family protein [Phycisphaeraceae bacterium]|nr:amidohydrolase family protein [Phycisphaeraceae bacterium]